MAHEQKVASPFIAGLALCLLAEAVITALGIYLRIIDVFVMCAVIMSACFFTASIRVHRRKMRCQCQGKGTRSH